MIGCPRARRILGVLVREGGRSSTPRDHASPATICGYMRSNKGDAGMDARTRDFTAVRAAMQRYVDQEILAGVSWCVLRGRDVVDQQCVGLADREANIALRP